MRFQTILAALYLTAMLAACSDFNNFYESKGKAQREKAGGPEVIAVVGSDEITRDDLMRALARVPYRQRKLYQSSPQKLNEFLDSYINQKILYSEAVKQGFDKREDILEKTENFKKKLIGQTFGQEILKNIKVTQNEVQDYYRKHKDDFEEIKISEIFIRTGPGKGVTKQSAFPKAEMVAEKAKAGGNWQELVQTYSDDSISKRKEGNIGLIHRGKFGPDIDNLVFSMKKGEITNPLEVDGGYFIIKIDEEPRMQPEGEVNRIIESQITNDKLIEYVNGLRKAWRVEVYRDRLEESAKSD
ncbi:MAG: peptidylprolyl isomerase [Thermodesulfobacteriota bacterium]